jgi:FlaA1/EpsC-like NDP-sugar epimerase
MKSILKYRRPLIVAFHIFLTGLANYLAFWIRFDGEIPDRVMTLLLQTLPWLIVVRGITFIPFRLYEGLWRYTGIWDLQRIIGGVFTGTVLFYSMVRWGLGPVGYPWSVLIIDSVLLTFFMGGVRLTRRIYRDVGHLDREKRILIYGAGDAGEMIVRDMKNNPFYEYEPIGFIDDDPSKLGQRIHGVKVLGMRDELSKILVEKQPDAVLVAMPKAALDEVRRLVKALESFKIPIKTLPSLRDVIGGKLEVSQIRNLSIEDLLERAPVGLTRDSVRHFIRGKRVMVTGAGGSIGSELCRQIVGLEPTAVILYERHENALYAMVNELTTCGSNTGIYPVIGDVIDGARVDAVMREYRPEIVFHAAAHKHVPLMERNPCEAVKNNVLGTRVVAEAANRSGIDRFVLISTDKAVNPTSVMGATKRVAEFLVQGMRDKGKTTFTVVRFGNVLGSNGSVVLRFLDQIKAGGPVTVTHPEMRRYFMLIPEAVQLVLHAAASAKGADIFVLEMGEQIKVLDMARNLIRLSGFVPDEEISIVFTGPRPGEKLFEELVGKDEMVEPAPVEKVLRIQSACVPNPTYLNEKIAELERLSVQGQSQAVVELLREVVPTYMPERSGDEHIEQAANRGTLPCVPDGKFLRQEGHSSKQA